MTPQVPRWEFHAHYERDHTLVISGHCNQPHESRGVRHFVSRVEMESSLLGPKAIVLGSILAIADQAAKRGDHDTRNCHMQMACWVEEHGVAHE